MKTSDITTEQVLLACINARNFISGPAPWQFLMEELNAPEKVVYSAMERDHKRGYLEYGVSLRTAWVTAKGYDYLKSIGYFQNS